MMLVKRNTLWAVAVLFTGSCALENKSNKHIEDSLSTEFILEVDTVANILNESKTE